jgi:hypothetical protein
MAMLLVSITAIYAYRIYKSSKDNVTSIKKWIIFAIFSLASAYTHYYGLVTVGLINLFLMIYLIIQSVKSKKLTKNLKMFIICAIAQIVLYIPWVVSLFTQMGHVSNSFWIYVTPNLFLELFTFYFTGNLKDSMNVSIPVAIIWSLFIEIYMIYLYAKDIRKSKKEKTEIRNKMRPAILSIAIFLGVIVAVSLVSVILWRPIIYARYMLCCMGLLMLFISYTMNIKGNKYINVLICTISVIMSLYLNIKFINTNYDDSNKEPISYIQEDISDEDIILVSNDGSGFVIIANFPRNTSYFWDQQIWNVEQAYKAFGIDQHTVYDLDCLKDYQGRIWVIGAGNYTLVDQIKDIYDIDVIKQETFSVKYKEYQYSISLIEKNN